MHNNKKLKGKKIIQTFLQCLIDDLDWEVFPSFPLLTLYKRNEHKISIIRYKRQWKNTCRDSIANIKNIYGERERKLIQKYKKEYIDEYKSIQVLGKKKK